MAPVGSERPARGAARPLLTLGAALSALLLVAALLSGPAAPQATGGADEERVPDWTNSDTDLPFLYMFNQDFFYTKVDENGRATSDVLFTHADARDFAYTADGTRVLVGTPEGGGRGSMELPPCEKVCQPMGKYGGGLAPATVSWGTPTDACSAPCYHNRVIVAEPGRGAVFSEGIRPDAKYKQGRFTQVPLGQACIAIDQINRRVYLYTPPRGYKSPDSPFVKGDVNPRGMRVIDLSKGTHVEPPKMEFAPLVMEIDLFAGPALAMITASPGEIANPLSKYMTVSETGKTPLALVWIDAKSGKPQTAGPAFPTETTSYLEHCGVNPTQTDCCTSGCKTELLYPDQYGTPNMRGQCPCPGFYGTSKMFIVFSKQFGSELASDFSCRNESIRDTTCPNNFASVLPTGFAYDYTALFAPDSAFDQEEQTFWSVLYNPEFPGSATLFGVSRKTVFDLTNPDGKIWTFDLDFRKFRFYRSPPEIMAYSSLEISPSMVERDEAGEWVGVNIAGNVKTMFAQVTLAERAGPCAPPSGRDVPSASTIIDGVVIDQGRLPENLGRGLKCGAIMSEDMVKEHNYVANLENDPTSPWKVVAPHSASSATYRGPISESNYNRSIVPSESFRPPRCICLPAFVRLHINVEDDDGTELDALTSRPSLLNANLNEQLEQYVVIGWPTSNFDSVDKYYTRDRRLGSTASWNVPDELVEGPLPSKHIGLLLSAFAAQKSVTDNDIVTYESAKMFFLSFDMDGGVQGVDNKCSPRGGQTLLNVASRLIPRDRAVGAQVIEPNFVMINATLSDNEIGYITFYGDQVTTDGAGVGAAVTIAIDPDAAEVDSTLYNVTGEDVSIGGILLSNFKVVDFLSTGNIIANSALVIDGAPGGHGFWEVDGNGYVAPCTPCTVEGCTGWAEEPCALPCTVPPTLTVLCSLGDEDIYKPENVTAWETEGSCAKGEFSAVVTSPGLGCPDPVNHVIRIDTTGSKEKFITLEYSLSSSNYLAGDRLTVHFSGFPTLPSGWTAQDWCSKASCSPNLMVANNASADAAPTLTVLLTEDDVRATCPPPRPTFGLTRMPADRAKSTWAHWSGTASTSVGIRLETAADASIKFEADRVGAVTFTGQRVTVFRSPNLAAGLPLEPLDLPLELKPSGVRVKVLFEAEGQSPPTPTIQLDDVRLGGYSFGYRIGDELRVDLEFDCNGLDPDPSVTCLPNHPRKGFWSDKKTATDRYLAVTLTEDDLYDRAAPSPEEVEGLPNAPFVVVALDLGTTHEVVTISSVEEENVNIPTTSIDRSISLSHAPINIFSSHQYSDSIQGRLGELYSVSTSAKDSTLSDSDFEGLDESTPKCPVRVWSCDFCKEGVKNEFAATYAIDVGELVNDSDFFTLCWERGEVDITDEIERANTCLTALWDPDVASLGSGPVRIWNSKKEFTCPYNEDRVRLSKWDEDDLVGASFANDAPVGYEARYLDKSVNGSGTACNRYTCVQCEDLFNTECGLRVVAGKRTLLTLQAFTVFGAPSRKRDDTWTVTVVASSVEGTGNNASNPAFPKQYGNLVKDGGYFRELLPGTVALGPVFRLDCPPKYVAQEEQGTNNVVCVDSTLQSAPDDLYSGAPGLIRGHAVGDTSPFLGNDDGWLFPNLDNRGYGTFNPNDHGAVTTALTACPLQNYGGSSFSTSCCPPTTLIGKGRCRTFLSRPRAVQTSAKGKYELEFALDRAGEYTIDVMLREDNPFTLAAVANDIKCVGDLCDVVWSDDEWATEYDVTPSDRTRASLALTVGTVVFGAINGPSAAGDGAGTGIKGNAFTLKVVASSPSPLFTVLNIAMPDGVPTAPAPYQPENRLPQIGTHVWFFVTVRDAYGNSIKTPWTELDGVTDSSIKVTLTGQDEVVGVGPKPDDIFALSPDQLTVELQEKGVPRPPSVDDAAIAFFPELLSEVDCQQLRNSDPTLKNQPCVKESFATVYALSADELLPAEADLEEFAEAKRRAIVKIGAFLTRPPADGRYGVKVELDGAVVSGPAGPKFDEALLNRGSEYEIQLSAAPSSALLSFAVEASSGEHGLGLQAPIVAGESSKFTVVPRDRFENNQLTTNAIFLVVVEDSTGKCAAAFSGGGGKGWVEERPKSDQAPKRLPVANSDALSEQPCRDGASDPDPNSLETDLRFPIKLSMVKKDGGGLNQQYAVSLTLYNLRGAYAERIWVYLCRPPYPTIPDEAPDCPAWNATKDDIDRFPTIDFTSGGSGVFTADLDLTEGRNVSVYVDYTVVDTNSVPTLSVRDPDGEMVANPPGFELSPSSRLRVAVEKTGKYTLELRCGQDCALESAYYEVGNVDLIGYATVDGQDLQFGVFSWAHPLNMVAGKTSPAHSVAWIPTNLGDECESCELGACSKCDLSDAEVREKTFTAGLLAGDGGESGRGLCINVGLNDKYGNPKYAVETAYAIKRDPDLGAPEIRMLLQERCDVPAGSPEIDCVGIAERTIDLGDGTVLVVFETPNRPVGSTVYTTYSPVSDQVKVGTGNGLTRWSRVDGAGSRPFSFCYALDTTLAGRFDVGISLAALDSSGLAEPQQTPIEGSKGTPSAARFVTPYLEPFPLVVNPASMEPATSELFYIDTEGPTLYSSHQGSSHLFELGVFNPTQKNYEDPPPPGLKAAGLIRPGIEGTGGGVLAVSGVSGKFFILPRDKYGNIVAVAADSNVTAEAQAWAVDPDNGSPVQLGCDENCGACAAGSIELVRTELGGQSGPDDGREGRTDVTMWSFDFCTTRALTYYLTATINTPGTPSDGLSTFTRDPSRGLITPGTNRYSITVKPGVPDSSRFIVAGSGLRGAKFQTNVSITVAIRDEFGNTVSNAPRTTADRLSLSLTMCTDANVISSCVSSDFPFTIFAWRSVTISGTRVFEVTYLVSGGEEDPPIFFLPAVQYDGVNVGTKAPTRGAVSDVLVDDSILGDPTENPNGPWPFRGFYNATAPTAVGSCTSSKDCVVARGYGSAPTVPTNLVILTWRGGMGDETDVQRGLSRYPGSRVGTEDVGRLAPVDNFGIRLPFDSTKTWIETLKVELFLNETAAWDIGLAGSKRNFFSDLSPTVTMDNADFEWEEDKDGFLILVVTLQPGLVTKTGFYGVRFTWTDGTGMNSASSSDYASLRFRPGQTDAKMTRVLAEGSVPDTWHLLQPEDNSPSVQFEGGGVVQPDGSVVLVAGSKGYFRIDPYDSYGNEQIYSLAGEGGPERFSVDVVGRGGRTVGTAIDVTSALVNFTKSDVDIFFTPTIAGNYTMEFFLADLVTGCSSVLCGGSGIAADNFLSTSCGPNVPVCSTPGCNCDVRLRVLPEQPSPAHSRVTVGKVTSDTAPAYVGDVVAVSVTEHDRFGNVCLSFHPPLPSRLDRVDPPLHLNVTFTFENLTLQRELDIREYPESVVPRRYVVVQSESKIAVPGGVVPGQPNDFNVGYTHTAWQADHVALQISGFGATEPDDTSRYFPGTYQINATAYVAGCCTGSSCTGAEVMCPKVGTLSSPVSAGNRAPLLYVSTRTDDAAISRTKTRAFGPGLAAPEGEGGIQAGVSTDLYVCLRDFSGLPLLREPEVKSFPIVEVTSIPDNPTVKGGGSKTTFECSPSPVPNPLCDNRLFPVLADSKSDTWPRGYTGEFECTVFACPPCSGEDTCSPCSLEKLLRLSLPLTKDQYLPSESFKAVEENESSDPMTTDNILTTTPWPDGSLGNFTVTDGVVLLLRPSDTLVEATFAQDTLCAPTSLPGSTKLDACQPKLVGQSAEKSETGEMIVTLLDAVSPTLSSLFSFQVRSTDFYGNPKSDYCLTQGDGGVDCDSSEVICELRYMSTQFVKEQIQKEDYPWLGGDDGVPVRNVPSSSEPTTTTCIDNLQCPERSLASKDTGCVWCYNKLPVSAEDGNEVRRWSVPIELKFSSQYRGVLEIDPDGKFSQGLGALRVDASETEIAGVGIPLTVPGTYELDCNRVSYDKSVASDEAKLGKCNLSTEPDVISIRDCLDQKITSKARKCLGCNVEPIGALTAFGSPYPVVVSPGDADLVKTEVKSEVFGDAGWTATDYCGANCITVVSGERNRIVVTLRDKNGNVRGFDPFAEKTDTVAIALASVPVTRDPISDLPGFEGTDAFPVPCNWTEPDRVDLPYRLDDDASSCVAVNTGVAVFLAGGEPATGPLLNATISDKDYVLVCRDQIEEDNAVGSLDNVSDVPGVTFSGPTRWNNEWFCQPDMDGTGLQVSTLVNADGTIDFNLTPDKQIPALPDAHYQLDIVLNSKPLKVDSNNDRLFKLRVIPGPMYGPMSEIISWTTGKSASVRHPEFVVPSASSVSGEFFGLTLQMRDRNGNDELESNAATASRIYAYFQIREIDSGDIVSLCTSNFSQASCAPATVALPNVNDLQTKGGQYVVQFKTDIASGIDLDKYDPDGWLPPFNDNGGWAPLDGDVYAPPPALIQYTGFVRSCERANKVCSQDLNVMGYGGTASTFGSPLSMTVLPDVTDAKACIVYGSDILQGGVVGVVSNFDIFAKDKFGNARLRGGDRFVVSLSSTTGTFDLTVDQGNILDFDKTSNVTLPSACDRPSRCSGGQPGRYRVFFEVLQPGDIAFTVGLDNETSGTSGNVDKSVYSNTNNAVPYREVDGNSIPCLAKLLVDPANPNPSGLLSFQVGIGGKIYVQSQTAPNGNERCESGSNDDCVERRSDGESCPYLKADVVPKKTGCQREASEQGCVVAFLSSKCQLSSNVQCDTSSNSALDVEDADDGTFIVTIPATIQVAQDYQLSVFFLVDCQPEDTSLDEDGGLCRRPAGLSPFDVAIKAGPISPAASVLVELAGGEGQYINSGAGYIAGDVSELTVQFKDSNQNTVGYTVLEGNEAATSLVVSIIPVDTGEAFERVDTAGPSLATEEFTVVYTDSGSALVSFRYDTAARITIGVSLSGVTLVNSGASVVVKPNVGNVANAILDRSIPTVTVGYQLTFLILVRDSYGNVVEVGGVPFSTQLLFSKLPVARFDGTYPDKITREGSGINPPLCLAEFVPDETALTASCTSSYTYSGTDALTDPTIEVSVDMEVSDQSNGTYLVSVRSEVAGSFELTALVKQTSSTEQQSICSTDDAEATCRSLVYDSGIKEINGIRTFVAIVNFAAGPPTITPGLGMHSYTFSRLGANETIKAGTKGSIPIASYDDYFNFVDSRFYIFTSSLTLRRCESEDLQAVESCDDRSLRLVGQQRYVFCGTPDERNECEDGMPNKHNVIDFLPEILGTYDLGVKRSGQSLRNLLQDQTFEYLACGEIKSEEERIQAGCLPESAAAPSWWPTESTAVPPSLTRGLVVTPGELSPEQTTISHPLAFMVVEEPLGDSSILPKLTLVAEAGVTTQFLIETYDKFGNALDFDVGSPDVTIGSVSSLDESPRWIPNTNQYIARYTIDEAQVVTIKVVIRDVPASKCKNCGVVSLPPNAVDKVLLPFVGGAVTDKVFDYSTGAFFLAIHASAPVVGNTEVSSWPGPAADRVVTAGQQSTVAFFLKDGVGDGNGNTLGALPLRYLCSDATKNSLECLTDTTGTVRHIYSVPFEETRIWSNSTIPIELRLDWTTKVDASKTEIIPAVAPDLDAGKFDGRWSINFTPETLGLLNVTLESTEGCELLDPVPEKCPLTTCTDDIDGENFIDCLDLQFQVRPNVLDPDKTEVVSFGDDDLSDNSHCFFANVTRGYFGLEAIFRDSNGNGLILIQEADVDVSIIATTDEARLPLDGPTARYAGYPSSTFVKTRSCTPSANEGSPPNASADADVLKCGLATHQGSFTFSDAENEDDGIALWVTFPPHVGMTKLDVIQGGVHIPGSPFFFEVTPGPMSALESMLMGWDHKRCGHSISSHAGGQCSTGALPYHLVNGPSELRYEVRPYDEKGNQVACGRRSVIAAENPGKGVPECDEFPCDQAARDATDGVDFGDRLTCSWTGLVRNDGCDPSCSWKWHPSSGLLVGHVKNQAPWAVGCSWTDFNVYLDSAPIGRSALESPSTWSGEFVGAGSGETLDVPDPRYTAASGSGLGAVISGETAQFTIYPVAKACIKGSIGSLVAWSASNSECDNLTETPIPILPAANFKVDVKTARGDDSDDPRVGVPRLDGTVLVEYDASVAGEISVTVSFTSVDSVVELELLTVDTSYDSENPEVMSKSDSGPIFPNAPTGLAVLTPTVYPSKTNPGTSSLALSSNYDNAEGTRATVAAILFDSSGNAVFPIDFSIMQEIPELDVEYVAPESGSDGPATEAEFDSLGHYFSLLAQTQLRYSDATGWAFIIEPPIAGTYTISGQVVPTAKSLFTGPEVEGDDEFTPLSIALDSPSQFLAYAAFPNTQYTRLTAPGFDSVKEAIDACSVGGDPVVLAIEARDENDNRSVGGPDSQNFSDTLVLTSTLSGALDDVFLPVEADVDKGPGFYKAEFRPALAGDYTIKLFLKGGGGLLTSDEGGYTAAGTVVRVKTDPLKSGLSGAGTIEAEVNEPTSFVILARDSNSNPILTDDVRFAVEISPASPGATNIYNVTQETVQAVVQPIYETGNSRSFGDRKPTGSYLATYTVPQFGDYALSVRTGDGLLVTGATIPLTVNPSPAPQVENAVFSGAGNSLTIDFRDTVTQLPIRTNRGGLIGLDDCSKVFDDASIQMFGKNPLCSFPSASRLQILLGYQATVLPGDSVMLKEFADSRATALSGIINSRRTSKRANGPSLVVLPTLAPSPRIILQSPRFISVCDDLVVDASGSHGAIGRKLTYIFGIGDNTPNGSVISDILRKANSEGASAVTIPGALLVTNRPTTIFVSARNAFLQKSTDAVTVVRKSYPIPVLKMEGPGVVKIKAGNSESQKISVNLNIPSDGTYTLPNSTEERSCAVDNLVCTVNDIAVVSATLGGADKTTCVDEGCTFRLREDNTSRGFCCCPAVFEYFWDFDRRQAIVQVFDYDGFDQERRTREISIPKGAVVAGESYSMTVSSRVKESQCEEAGYIDGKCRVDLNTEVNVVIQAEYSLLTVLLTEPPFDKAEFDLVLSVDESTDPNETQDRPETLTPFLFSWECSPINPVLGVPDVSKPCFIDDSGILAPPPEDTKLVIPKGTLLPGKYMFTVTARKEPFNDKDGKSLGRILSVSREVTITTANSSLQRRSVVTVDSTGTTQPANTADDCDFFASIAPLGQTDQGGESKPVWFSNKKLILKGEVRKKTNLAPLGSTEALTLEWSVSNDGAPLDLEEYRLTASGGKMLSIVENALAAGSTYEFEFKVTSPDCEASFADIKVVVVDAPASGQIEVMPTVVEAITGLFTFEFRGWEDPGEQDTTYEAYYVDPEDCAEIPLVPSTRSNKLEGLLLPDLVPEDAKTIDVTLAGVVKTSAGAASRSTVTITLSSPSYAKFPCANSDWDSTRTKAQNIAPPYTIGLELTADQQLDLSTSSNDPVDTVYFCGRPALALDQLDVVVRASRVGDFVRIAQTCTAIGMLALDHEQDVDEKATALDSGVEDASFARIVALAVTTQVYSECATVILDLLVNNGVPTRQLSTEDRDLLTQTVSKLAENEDAINVDTILKITKQVNTKGSSTCNSAQSVTDFVKAASAVSGNEGKRQAGKGSTDAGSQRLAARRALLEGGLSASAASVRRQLQLSTDLGTKSSERSESNSKSVNEAGRSGLQISSIPLSMSRAS